MQQKLELIKQHIKSYPDFPVKDVLFRDIFSVLKHPDAFSALKDVMLEHVKALQPPVQAIAALDSRGFLFGPLLALELQVPLIPIRKKGKLPGKIKSISYSLEYGQDVFEVQEGSINPGDRILIVDDLLATGGSLSASAQLIKMCQAEVAECFVIIELVNLKGREKISASVHSLIQY